MKPSKLRAWWSHRQGLDGSLVGASPAHVLERSGWARSVGGAGPYLTLFSRGRCTREQTDAAVAALEIHELPTARGCTYVLPASEFALGLTVGQPFSGGEMKTALTLGVTEDEIERLCEGVVNALARNGPLDPDAIREATGTASRSLGEEGKKKGVSTTLPIALGRLQAQGEIRRVPMHGRLDQQRFRYARWSPSPLTALKLTADTAMTELARRYFQWIGPATMGEFRWFAGLGVKAAKRAVEPLGLVSAEKGGDRLLDVEDEAAWRRFEPPTEPQYALVSSLDTISAARREMLTLLDDRDHDRRVFADSAERPVGALVDLPAHVIVDRGRIVGFWEFDVDTRSIVAATFGIRKSTALAAAIEETQSFVRDQLGDARSFSLDSPKSRVPKIEALRRMQ